MWLKTLIANGNNETPHGEVSFFFFHYQTDIFFGFQLSSFGSISLTSSIHDKANVFIHTFQLGLTFHNMLNRTFDENDRCDRILWRGDSMKQMYYERGESKFSDHRPVSSMFSLKINITNSKQPSHTNVFLTHTSSW